MPSLDTNWNMLGHEWAVELLRGRLQHERIRHAYLITGPQGVGRRTLALRLAQAVNCQQSESLGQPCGSCLTCQQIERMQHADLSIVQAEEGSSSIKVDQIREIQHSLSLAPYQAEYRVALLLNFEQANPNAANALLKTLEEPAPRVILILTALDAEALLPTIVSRCEVIRLRPLAIDQVAEGLQTRWQVPAEKARLLAHIAGGRPGYALKLSQNPEVLEQRQSWLDDHQRLLGANRAERFAFASELSKDKNMLIEVLQTWLTLWRDVMLQSSGSSAAISNINRVDEISVISRKVDIFSAKKIIRQIEHTLDLVEHFINPRLASEILFMDLPHLK